MTDNPTAVKETFPRRFYFLLGSQGLSGIGSEMQQIALPLWIYQQTGSTMSAAVSFAIQYVPIVLLAPWVGHIADRFERRRLMVVCELIAAGLVSVTLLGVQLGLLPLVVVLAGVSRVCNAFTMPAMQAITVSIVPQSGRARSASLTTMAFSGSLMVAPLAGTAIAGTVGFHAVLLIDIASFLLAALLLLPLSPVPGAAGLRHAARSTWQAYREHVTPRLRWFIGAEAVFFLLWGADSALALLILENEFGAAQAGVFASGAGVGWVLASIVVTTRLKERPAPLIAVGALCGPVAAVGFVTMLPYGIVAAFFPCLLIGVGNLLVVTGASVVFQQESPPEATGRLFAVRRAVLNSSLAISYLMLPAVSAAWLGHQATLILFGFLMMAGVLTMVGLGAYRLRSLAAAPVADHVVRS